MALAVLLVALVPLVVLLYLFLLLCAFSRLSGWSRLAAAYPGRARPASPRRWFGYGVFRGWLGYNGGLVVGADERGLEVAGMPILLAFCHPPIFIPWTDVVEIRRRRILWAPCYGIRTRRAPEVDSRCAAGPSSSSAPRRCERRRRCSRASRPPREDFFRGAGT